LSEIDSYNGKNIKLRNEVGLLSRNILITGVSEELSGELMVLGNNCEARIENVEFRYSRE